VTQAPPTTSELKAPEEYNPNQAQQQDYSYKPNYGAEEEVYKTTYDTYQP
jgi:hypothetical protein